MKAILKNSLGKAITHLWKAILQKKGYFALFAGLIGVAYALGLSLKSLEAVLVIGGLFILASFSTIYKRYFRAPPVFELMTISTVIVTARYGIGAGFLFGALSQIASEALSGAIDAQIIIFVPARAMLAVFTSIAINMFNVSDVFILGLLAILSYNLMVQPISWVMGDMQLRAKTIYYTLGYTIVNLFIFSVLSKPANVLLGWG